MKTLLRLLLVFLCLISYARGGSFRVATFNLNWGNRRGDLALNAITAAKPDLICFQETTVQSERFLRDKLSAEFPHFISVGHKGRFAAERFAFASKTHLTDPKYSAPADGLFGFYAVTVSIDDTHVRVINMHLTPVVLKRGDRFTAAMTALSDAEAKHKAEIVAITGGIDPKEPSIVAGDFNSISTFVAPTALTELGLTDSFASVHDDADTQPTWTWPTRPLPISRRIDYIFHTKHFSTLESTIVPGGGSDHSLVVSELQLVPSKGE